MAVRLNRKSLRPALAAAIYVGIASTLLGSAWTALAALAERHATVQAAEAMLAQLEGRAPANAKAGRFGFPMHPGGGPFIEGQTVTVAGAALLQRIAGAVTTAGGNVLSSQVDLQKASEKDGTIGLVVSCEIDQAGLQPLLYDLETGMPFLFVEQVVISAPVASVEESRMRVLLAVSGQWEGRK